jgi:hypothetical protein
MRKNVQHGRNGRNVRKERKLKQGNLAECLTDEEEYILWRDQYDWDQKEQIMDKKWREDEEAGFEKEEEGTDGAEEVEEDTWEEQSGDGEEEDTNGAEEEDDRQGRSSLKIRGGGKKLKTRQWKEKKRGWIRGSSGSECTGCKNDTNRTL